MTEIRLGIRENVRHLNGKRILQLPGEGFAKIRAPDAGFFLPKCWEVGKYTFERQMRINQADVKCCLLSNQTIVCLFSLFIFAFGNERRIRESDRQKKNAGCGIFYKNLSSNRRSKSRMESDNLEEPLVFNCTIASSYHLGDLFLSFFFFFFFTENVL